MNAINTNYCKTAGRRAWQKGLALIESAVTLPILVLLLVVIMDFGRIMYSGIISSNSARAGAGYGAQTTLVAVDHNGMNNAALADATDLPVDSNNSEHVDTASRHFCLCPGGTAEVNCTANTCGAAPEVYVEVSTGRVFGTLINYPGIPDIVNLHQTATIRVQ